MKQQLGNNKYVKGYKWTRIMIKVILGLSYKSRYSLFWLSNYQIQIEAKHQTSKTDFFCENSSQMKAINYFPKTSILFAIS